MPNNNKLEQNMLYYSSRNYIFKQDFNDSMYQTHIFNVEGINYNNWIKFRKSVIEKISKIRPEGLHLLLGLLSHPYTINKEFLQTSLVMINKHVNFKTIKEIKILLKLLQEYGFIFMEDYVEDTINQQDIFKIHILYNSDEMYEVPHKDYWKPIPLDYINKCLMNLSSIDIAILFTLIVYQNFYVPLEYEDKSLNQVIYTFCYTSYAYPKLEQMADWLCCNRQTIRNHVVSLSEKNIVSYIFNGKRPYNENGKFINPNYQYRVTLLCRIEYVYFWWKLSELYENRESKVISLIRNDLSSALKSNIQKQCRPSDYIYCEYLKYMSQLDVIINNKDNDTYNTLLQKRYQLIENFENVDLKPIPKKKEKKKVV